MGILYKDPGRAKFNRRCNEVRRDSASATRPPTSPRPRRSRWCARRRRGATRTSCAGQREAIGQGLEHSVALLAERLGIQPAEALKFLLAIQKLETMEAFAHSPSAKTVLWDTATRDAALETLKALEVGK